MTTTSGQLAQQSKAVPTGSTAIEPVPARDIDATMYTPTRELIGVVG